MAVPYTFQSATGSIPLSQLDSNFATAITIGNTAVVLGDTITTVNNLSLANVAITSVSTAFPNGYLANSNVIVGTTTLTLGSTVTAINGLSLSNVTISSGNVTISNVTTTNVTATTANVTTANIGTLVVIGDASVGGNTTVTGNITAAKGTFTSANVSGTANVQIIAVTQDASVAGNITATGNITGAKGTFTSANVSGIANVATLAVVANSTVGGNVSITGNISAANGTFTSANISGTANVSTLVIIGNTTVGGNVTVTGNVSMNVATITTANVSGTANISTLVITTNQTSLGNITATGNVTAAKLIPTGTSVTGNGLYLPAANALGLSTNGTNAVYIDASQNVGIGTTTLTNKLNVAGAIQSSSSLAAIGASTVALSQESGFSRLAAFGTNSSTAGTLYLYVIDSSGGNQRGIIIDSSGRVGIGGTGYGPGTASLDLYAIQGVNNAMNIKPTTNSSYTAIQFFNSSQSGIGAISCTTTATSYGTGSDYRLKENVLPMIGALNKVAQLRPVTFDWISDKTASQGFIAHELQAVVPDCVVGEKDGVDADGNPKYQSIDTSFLVATLTAAIQEQQSLITALTARITALEAK